MFGLQNKLKDEFFSTFRQPPFSEILINCSCALIKNRWPETSFLSKRVQKSKTIERATRHAVGDGGVSIFLEHLIWLLNVDSWLTTTL